MQPLPALSRKLLSFKSFHTRYLNTQLIRKPFYRDHSTQTTATPLQTPVEENNVDTLDDVFQLLQVKQIAWNGPGPAQFDFRSDVVTSPNLAMLRAIVETTLLDDVYREDTTTISFEQDMAKYTGHEAGIFVLSGTMANQVALRTHLIAPPHAVLCDERSHIIHWEAGGLGLSGAMIQSVKPSNGEFLVLEDIQRKAELSDDVHKCPTAVISLENTISGVIHPLRELRRISSWARENGLKLHLDGARLWEVVAAGKGNLKDYAECFDSVALDISKGIGAPMGAVIVGSSPFITRARRIRKGLGGGMRQAGVLSGPARVAVSEFFSDGGGKVKNSHYMATRVANMWEAKGGMLGRRTETNSVWVDLNHAGVSEVEFIDIGSGFGVKLHGGRIVLHYQISEEGLRRLESVFDRVLSTKKSLV